MAATPAADTQPLLALREIEKAFGGVRALRGASFEVRPGEVHTILGENGAGKSTLVRVIGGIHAADSGEIWWEAGRLQGLDLQTADALGIRIIHQRLTTVPHLTVAANIVLGHEPRRARVVLDAKRERATAEAALSRVGVNLDVQKQAGELPVAERQLVEIARALQGPVRLLVMDEPTASLGEREVARLFDVIRGLRDEGVALVFISHKLDEVMEISDRVTVMRDGRSVETVRVGETTPHALVELMVGREFVAPVTSAASIDAAAEPLLEVDGLETDTGLRDVSFSVLPGEIVGVYGLMGSGRTELARALGGADRIGAGRVRFKGCEVKLRSSRAARRMGIGFVPEERRAAAFDLLTVRENISAASGDLISARGVIRPSREQAIAKEAVRRLGIRTPSTEESMANLSGGNQQKVILARWLMRDVDLLILDDPTAGVDVGAKAEIYRLIHAITSTGKSVLMTSSELPELLALSHRILVLHRGRVAGLVSGDDKNERNVLHLAVRGSGVG